MGWLEAVDVSRWQGDINWFAVDRPIAIIKMTGADDGLYTDSKANRNYYGAKAAGKAVGMYHFAGATDARQEAEYFVNACSPLEENDVLVLDWEVQHGDPVGWCLTFVNRVHELTGVWPLLYMNGSTFNSRDWSPVTKHCGVWIAWYGRDPSEDVISHPYVMHQYTSTGSVPGITGNVDLNAFFGTVEQFNKYGWHAEQSSPAPEPAPAPQPVPVPDPEPTPEPVPEEPPVEVPEPGTVIVPVPGPVPPVADDDKPYGEGEYPAEPTTPVKTPWWKSLLQIILNFLFKRKK